MSALTYTVAAFNTAVASENKIHDDAVAARFGFTGGLVPGVEVFAYATHVPLMHFGHVWLERGRMDMRFVKPVYDGQVATVGGMVAGECLALTVASAGTHCAEGSAAIGALVAPRVHDRHEPPAHDHRPPADESSLAVGRLLSTRPRLISSDVASAYLTDIRETAPLYRDADLIHPGLLLRACNAALVDNVVLPPWIHVGSQLQLLSVGMVGETIQARAQVTANYDRKGHRLVDLDVVVFAEATRPLAHVRHTAIYRLRS